MLKKIKKNRKKKRKRGGKNLREGGKCKCKSCV